MNCRIVRRKVLADLQTIASEAERRELETHLRTCPACGQEWAQRKLLRTGLRALPRRTPPPELTLRLRVLASRHLHETDRRWMARIIERLRLDFENLMRPLAVPFAGGLVSTIFLFAMLVPSLAVNLRFTHDIPTGLLTDAALKSTAPLSFDSGEAVVEVTFDDQGHMVDYSIVNDRTREENASFCHSIANYLLFTTFTPPTAFGQPVAGTIRLTFRSSYVNVRG